MTLTLFFFWLKARGSVEELLTSMSIYEEVLTSRRKWCIAFQDENCSDQFYHIEMCMDGHKVHSITLHTI